MGTQLDGVEFLCAEIAEREERAVGSESRPNPHGSKSRTLVLKVREGFGRAVADANADDRHALNVDHGQESVVADPFGISERALRQLPPVTRLEVIQHQPAGACADSGQITTGWRKTPSDSLGAASARM